ncbi:DMT family transporter [Profundibacter sp.]|uniref:DMT family transporter n=1 Tax=Profundibacter sp. TaxID=3101071 RepID=UPI003D0EBD9E
MSTTARAAIWMIGAILSFSSLAVAGRTVSAELDTFELLFYRSVIGIVIVTGVAAMAGTLPQVNRHRIGTHLLRNIAHFAGQSLWYFALTVIPLAQVFALEFTSPLWVVLLSPLLLGERLTPFRLMVTALGFVGILIITRPGAETLNWGVAAAALAAVCFATTSIFTKRLTRDVSLTGILFWLVVMQSMMGLAVAGYDGEIHMPSAAIWPWLLWIGLAGLIAHFCLTKALSIAPASTVVPLDFARLPLIAVVGAVFYGEALDIYVFAGAALIFAANYLNIRYSQSG